MVRSRKGDGNKLFSVPFPDQIYTLQRPRLPRRAPLKGNAALGICYELFQRGMSGGFMVILIGDSTHCLTYSIWHRCSPTMSCSILNAHPVSRLLSRPRRKLLPHYCPCSGIIWSGLCNANPGQVLAYFTGD